MTSGLKSLRRIEAVDLDGNRVAVLLGHTSGGRPAVGIVPTGRDSADIALLNADSQAKFLAAVRSAAADAAEESL